MAQFTASVQVKGLDTLDGWLRQLPKDVAETIMGDALGAGGEVIRAATAKNIHTRSGKTAADLRVDVQVKDDGGVAAIGGTTKGRTGRGYVLRWLELGTKAHQIRPKQASRSEIRRVTRALDPGAALAFAKGLASGRIRRGKGAIVWRGARHPVRVAQHRATAPQSPLTRALAESGDHAIAVFRDRLWSGILAASLRLWRRT